MNLKAFDLSKLNGMLNDGTVENVINGVIGSSNIEVKDLVGTWRYKAPSISFESNDLLKKAGGVAASTTIENKIAPYYTKAGLNASVITFTSDGRFSLTFKKGKINGVVTKANGHFIFSFSPIGKSSIGKMNANITKGTTLEITFDASKMVALISKISAVSGNSTVETGVKLLESYNGIWAGFEFAK